MAKDPTEIVLKDVVLSYAHLVDPDTQDGRERWRVSCMIDPDSRYADENLDAAEAAIIEAAKEKWGAAWEKRLPPTERLCLRQRDEDDDRFPGWYFLNAASTQRPDLVLPVKGPDGRWQVLDVDRPADREKAEELFYSGARANVVVKLWAQDNQHGKRINAFLNAVQFRAHGERLAGGSRSDVNELFSDDDVEEVEFDMSDYESDGGAADADAAPWEREGRQPARRASRLGLRR